MLQQLKHVPSLDTLEESGATSTHVHASKSSPGSDEFSQDYTLKLQLLKPPKLKFIKPVEELLISHKGLLYDETSLGLCIDFPQGAIPKGQLLKLKVGMCLYGPFKFPDNTSPIAPILMLRSQEDIFLQKPVKVTLPHIIHQATENDVEALEIRVVKADHTRDVKTFVFTDIDPKETNINFSQDEDIKEYATFFLSHFCFISLRSATTSEAARKKGFCISPMYPVRVTETTSQYTYHLPITYYMDPWLVVSN